MVFVAAASVAAIAFASRTWWVGTSSLAVAPSLAAITSWAVTSSLVAAASSLVATASSFVVIVVGSSIFNIFRFTK